MDPLYYVPEISLPIACPPWTHHYVNMFDTDLGREYQKEKTFRKGTMRLTLTDSSKWALEIDRRVEHSSISTLSV